MKTTRWKDLKHKNPPEVREQIKREALAELDRMGFAALRKAREMTQVELAEVLGIDQASVSAIENRTDLHLSTLAKYIRALGGDIEIRAVFPEATFNLEPLPPALPKPSGKKKKVASRQAPRATARTTSTQRAAYRKAG